MAMLNYNNASFLTSVAELNQLPSDTGAEVAFIGRSNAGKSSAINTITGIKGLAHISKTPGRTQLLNFFTLEDEHHRLVDLPGYGYAKVPLATKKRWEQLVNNYLAERQSLRGLIVVMDIRHPLKESDQKLIHWAVDCQVPIHILLTKADKLSHGAAKTTLLQVREALQKYGETIRLQLFSSHAKQGVEDIHATLDHWLCQDIE